MEKFISLCKQFIKSEVFKYLFFGVLTTLVYMVVRLLIFEVIPNGTVSVVIANITAVLFAFFTNDRFVFNQASAGWFGRLIKFTLARLSTLALDLVMAYLLVDTFPGIIGQFLTSTPVAQYTAEIKESVNGIETLMSQILIMAVNYLISKLFVFKDKK
ncbi:GtrA family protein [Streptococcus loxodontisalivarius]|uniref:Flippase GtrA n=1 Tax=Streptococcus loxodontisalivarius TaxID=1349415 RepID=A0ABS2PTW4_9STRE|nr:GtrA family protein [Streptococcus loxodontisalivarius]MBM7643498.1 putative flippase GtrA [Streptococcus loxodontisalivarius]